MYYNIRNDFGYLWKVSESNKTFRKVQNIQRNILEGSGVDARRGTMGLGPNGLHQGSRPRQEEEGVAEFPSNSDWRWSPIGLPPLLAPRKERGSPLGTLPFQVG